MVARSWSHQKRGKMWKGVSGWLGFAEETSSQEDKDVLLEAQREQRRASALIEVLKAVQNENGLVARLLEIGKDVMACEQVTLFFMDEARGVLVAANTIEAKEICVKLGQGIAGSVALSKETANIPDAYDDERFDKRTDTATGFRTRSVLCAPVLDFRGECVAVLQALNKKTRSKCFDEEDEFVFATLASELRRPLRRAAMEHAFHGACARAKLNAEPSVLAMLFDSDKSNNLENTTDLNELCESSCQEEIASDQKQVEKAFIDSNLSSFEWDVTASSPIEIRSMILAIMEADDTIRLHKIDRTKLNAFIDAIQSSYPENHYHNFEHGVCVMHASFVTSRIAKIVNSALSSLDVLALKIAALGHDVDHPGTNNDFEINTNSQRALIYNDIAVLENHHASFLFTTLRKPHCNALSLLSRSAYIHFRKTAIAAILATDMSRHGKHVQLLRDAAADASVSETNRQVSVSTQFLVDTCIHLGDMINSAHPHFSVAKKWGYRVIAEFKHQAARELELGLPVSPSMAKLETNSDIARSQIGFIDYVVHPLVSATCFLMPELNQLQLNLAMNRKGWTELGQSSTKPLSTFSSEEEKNKIHPVSNQADTTNDTAAAATKNQHSDSPTPRRKENTPA